MSYKQKWRLLADVGCDLRKIACCDVEQWGRYSMPLTRTHCGMSGTRERLRYFSSTRYNLSETRARSLAFLSLPPMTAAPDRFHISLNSSMCDALMLRQLSPIGHSAWCSASCVLLPSSAAPDRRYRSNIPACIESTKDGRLRCDFGERCSWRIRDCRLEHNRWPVHRQRELHA